MISRYHAHSIIGVGYSDASRMRRILIGCISAVVLFAVSTAFAVETWRVEELSFEAAKDYTSGGGDAVLMDVAFAHSFSGTEIVRPAFWDGGRTFRVRFAPTCAGDWKWRVKCPDDASLDGKAGLITCVPYSGKLEIYRRGFVKAEPGRKYFTYADGTAFFYLGDTHWGMYREEIDKAVHWSTAIEFPSAIQMGHMKRFFMSFDWWRMEPILGRNNGVFAPESHAWHGAVIDGKRRTFIFYFHPKSGAGLRTGTILSLPPNSRWIARWFNPRSGKWHEGEIRLDANASGHLKLPPLLAEGDWTLVVN